MSWIWKSYVDENLLPRLHGFEIMMASYAMAHLKLDLTLQSTGYQNKDQQRLGIYLTNSLEEDHEDTGTLFANWLSQEAKEASHIKKNMPIMTIIGNPPYSISSSNKSDWIVNLIEDYKKNLNERNIQPLSDDYIKFIRYWEQYIQKNWEWILAYISNNSYLDGITHRQMRKHLLETFDTIYIYDLHGNARKKEISPNGSVDQNVFDIMAGVNIIFWVKTGNKKKWELAKVLHYDSYGKRQEKYDNLLNSDITSVKWTELNYKEPYYFFVPKDFTSEEKYTKNISLKEIFSVSSIWIVTWKDKELISINKNDLLNTKISYRPFDIQYTVYDNKILQRSRSKIMDHVYNLDNLILSVWWTSKNIWVNCLISNNIVGKHFVTSETYSFPLYIYNEQKDHLLNEDIPEKVPNFDMEIIEKIEKKLKMKLDENFSPEDLFDYIYAVLHSKSYRETYKEFLKIDFPKVPFDVKKEEFFELVKLWRELRSFHLMVHEDLIPKNFITQYPMDGNNEVEKIKYILDETEENNIWKVFINDEQYFDWVPKNVWEFYIGGYQPAQKWLKDRKARELNYEDILHYSKIILCLKETVRIMEEIENIFTVE